MSITDSKPEFKECSVGNQIKQFSPTGKFSEPLKEVHFDQLVGPKFAVSFWQTHPLPHPSLVDFYFYGGLGKGKENVKIRSTSMNKKCLSV